jgi:hypothetical protein
MNITCFISHSWRGGEHDFAVMLADALESHGIEKVWVDEREIPGGGYIGDAVVKGVQTCDVFLFVMSPNAVNSSWCRRELDEALRQRSETGIQIIPVLLQDCSIPEELGSLLYVDFRDEKQFEQALKRLLTGIKRAYLVRAIVLKALDVDPGTRFEAAQELAALKDRFTVPILTRRLKTEPDPTVRYWLAYALGQIGGEEACTALKTARVRETDEFAKQGIIEGLQATNRLNN